MAGVAGALGAELLGQGDWYQAPLWVSPLIFTSVTSLLDSAGLDDSFSCHHLYSPGWTQGMPKCWWQEGAIRQSHQHVCKPFQMVCRPKFEAHFELQAVNGGAPTYLGIPVPFNLSTLLAIVRAPFPFPAHPLLALHIASLCHRGLFPAEFRKQKWREVKALTCPAITRPIQYLLEFMISSACEMTLS